MSEKQDDIIRKDFLENDASIIHEDLQQLISTIDQCNKYLNIFFNAYGVYDKAADSLLLQILEGSRVLTEGAL